MTKPKVEVDRARPPRGDRPTSSAQLIAPDAPKRCRLGRGPRAGSAARPPRPAARKRRSRRSAASRAAGRAALAVGGRAEVGARREGAGGARPSPPARQVAGVAFDTMLAGYLLDPAAAEYPLRALCEQYLGVDVLGEVEGQDEGQLFSRGRLAAGRGRGGGGRAARPGDGGADRPGRGSATCSRRGDAARVGAGADGGARRGARRRLPRRRWARRSATGWPRSRAEIYRARRRGVQPELAAAAPRDPVREARAVARASGRRRASCRPTPSVLEKLRDQHPIVDALLEWRELDKLNSTYLDALPRLVDPRRRPRSTPRSTRRSRRPAGCRRRTRTCRTSRSGPSSAGRSGGRSSPATPGQVLLVRRLLADRAPDPRAPVGRRGAARGVRDRARHPHRHRRRACSGCPEDKVDPALRRRAKMVNYGLAYGMNAWGLASAASTSRPTRRRRSWTRTSRGFPTIREYLDRQVDRATVDGYTETLLGRRRYIPELQAANPRVRDLGRRMALNAPIQGERQRRVQGRDDRAWTARCASRRTSTATCS